MDERDEMLESVFEGASPRPEPPPEVRDRVYAAVDAEWRRHKRRRWRLPVGLAAGLLAAAGAAFLVVGSTPPVRVEITATRGIEVGGERYDSAGAELALEPDTVLEAESATRLTTALGTDVRLRGGTRMRWSGASDLVLEQGTVYVDTSGRDRLRVHTPYGVVSDIGTTFMVTLEQSSMEVAMRDGAARVSSDHGEYLARADGAQGDVVTIDASRMTAGAEPASAERWGWIHAVSPGYRSREVLSVLRAIAEDLGLVLEFESPAVEAAVLQSRLDGDLDSLAPQQALEVVLGTAGLARRDAPGDTLVIGFQSLSR